MSIDQPGYEDLAFDEFVRSRQGSLEVELPTARGPFEFDPRDVAVIRQADSFFMGTVTGAGWPYVQHRGGPPGFVHVLSPTTLAWAELEGNHQFVSTGNIDRDGRVALFFINYSLRHRVKVFGHARIVEQDDDPELMRTVRDLGEKTIRSKGVRVMVVEANAADRNCAKYINPKFSQAQVEERLELYRAGIAELKEDNDKLKARIADLEADRE